MISENLSETLNNYLLKKDVFLSFFDKYLLFCKNIVLHLWREIN